MSHEIRHQQSPKGGAFHLGPEAKELGKMSWRRDEQGRMEISHTWVDPSTRGTGAGRALVEAGVAFARESGLRIHPTCTYARRVLEADPQYADILDRR